MDVTLVTCKKLPEPDPDAAPLSRALDDAGIEHAVLPWDDSSIDWPHGGLIVLRSSWNYPLHIDEFLSWASRVAGRSELWNPLPVVRWNAHKKYLLELEKAGIPIAPTALVPTRSRETLAQILERTGWEEVVVKPAVSAASWRTKRVGDAHCEAGESHLRDLTRERDVLVQQYLPSVEDHGERALVWIDDVLTHAVRKSPRFSGEDESVSDAMPISSAEAGLAHRVIAALEERFSEIAPPLYARIDVAPGPGGEPVVMELELIEPSLFFPQCEPALDRFVNGIRRRLDATRKDR